MIVDLYLKVLNLSISAIPLMAALLALRLIFKKAVPRKIFYIAWAFVFLRLMVPFSLESNLSFFNIVPEAEVVEENVGTSVVFVKNERERVEFPVFVNPGRDNPNVDMPYHSAITGEIVTGPDITTVPMDKNQIFGTVWIFGTGALLLFGIIGYFAVLRKLKFESIEYTDKIRLSEFFRTPVVCGLIKPKIILPMNFDLDDEAKVASVISHECTHIRRGDNLWRLLATFTLYVHWFNPLVWICYNAFIRDMEVSCDEAVLSGAKNDIRTEYAESLVALAGNGTNPLYGGVLSFGECAVKERVKCIMNFKKITLLIVIICVAAAVAFGVIFLTNPSAGKNENTADISVVPAEGTEISYSKENGIEMEAVITNNGKKTIWVDSATIVQAEIDGEEKFAGAFGSGGVLMLKAGESALFCGDIPMDSFEGNFAFNLPEGRYTLRRAVFFDEALTPTDVYAEYSFEIRENNSLETAEDIVAFAKENPDLLGLIENPAHYDNSIDSYRTTMHWEKYKEANPGIPDVVVQFFYLYHSAFVTLEVPDFSELDKETGNFYRMEQYLKYHVARERIESGDDYVTDFELKIEKESGEYGTFVYSCQFDYKHKSGGESGGVERWKFVLIENPETGKEEIELFEWVQKGYGGLYPGLENIFDDIRMRYYPHHNENYDLIANIGIVELMLENGFFENPNRPSVGNRKGDIVTFGNYNGELEWLVIGEGEGKLLLITKDCIEALPYHENRKKITWENSDIRRWLNEDFIESAFSEEEKTMISETVLKNPDNKRMFGAIGGNSTTDMVFLLSHDEVLEYFPDGWNIYTEPTPAAEKNLYKDITDGREYWWWWTRSPGLGQDMATIVNGVTFGIGDDGIPVEYKCGIRPAIWINVSGGTSSAKDYPETKANFSSDFSGKIVSGEVANKFIPSKDFSNDEVLAASNKAEHYGNFINNICSGKAETVIKGITLIVQPSDKDYVLEMDKETAKAIMSMLGEMEIRSTTESVNPSTGGFVAVYIEMETGGITRISYDGRLIITGEGYENASVFDGEICRKVFSDIRLLAEENIGDSEEYCEGEANPAIGYNLYADVYSGEAPKGKYIPKGDVLPKNIVWADAEQKKYCEDLIDSIDLGFASAFMVGSYSDEYIRVGIGREQANALLNILKDTNLVVSAPKNPDMPLPMEIHIVMESGDYIKIVWDTGCFTLYRMGDENAYRFDASRMKEFFIKFSNLADSYFIQGAGTQSQFPSEPVDDWTGTNYVIPMNVETVATIFNNTEKTAVTASSATNDLLRSLLSRKNFVKRLDDESMNELGKPLSGIDAVEFARTSDGKKYTFYLYENGFVLSGSAVPESEKNQAWIVYERPGLYFLETAETEFSESEKVIPYWFGLVNEKNILEINAKHQNLTRGYAPGNNLETDFVKEIVKRIRNISVSSKAEKFFGNELPEVSGDQVVLTVEFNTWTKYTVILTRTEVIMVSSDMNYGLRYKTDIDGYDYFLDFATEEGLINAVTG
ncbi:MAG: M56 family metallopeptidase [Oscillospiraceae bacterium]|nr:M56 family metallopeptidase [Oscillospiraceae bacterium]